MRYKEEFPPGTEPIVSIAEHNFLPTAILAVVLGIAFIVAGLKGKQYWIAVIGLNLIMAGIIYFVYLSFGIL